MKNSSWSFHSSGASGESSAASANQAKAGHALSRFAQVSLRLPVLKLPASLLLIACAFVAIHLFLDGTKRLRSVFSGGELHRLFDLNGEANIPTLFSSSLWLINAIVAYLIFFRHRSIGIFGYRYFYTMIILFIFLAIDESAMIHEFIGAKITMIFQGSGFFFYPWVIFGIIFAFLTAAFFSYFMSKLRLKHALVLLLAGFVFVCGALGVEMIGAAVESGSLARIPGGLNWPTLIALEEFLEMCGPIILLYGLLDILASEETPYR
jgi:hypothetical protein